MPYLTEVQFCLPSKSRSFEDQFGRFVSPLAKVDEHTINLAITNEDFLPKTSFIFKGNEPPYMQFRFDKGDPIKVVIANTTGATKQSPHHYSHITLEEFTNRMLAFPVQGLDHTGFNLPYFHGVHPTILQLRQKLRHKCLYHTFPKHLEDAPWDFIIPGTKAEIDRLQEVDYQRIRKPKIEIVSFENSSTPLIQIDIQVQGKYEDMASTFPEALHVPEIRNIWVYIESDLGTDVCFVLNEVSGGDWSHEFRNDRLS